MSDQNQSSEFLTSVLGSVLEQQESPAFIEAFQQLQHAFKQSSKQDLDKESHIYKTIESYSPEMVTKIIRASNIYFHLINIADERRNYQQRSQQYESHLWKSSFNGIIETLKSRSYTAKDVENLLQKIDYRPVFTAHPTEAKRRTILEVTNKIRETYKDYIQAQTVERKDEYQQLLKALVKILWKTEEVREDKPSVVQEIETSLYFFKTTIFSVIPELYKNLHRALKLHYPNDKFDIPKIIRYGSWVGGDRDGNPFVTPELTRKALRLQQETILQEYISRVAGLAELLTHNDKLCELSLELVNDLKNSKKLAKAAYAEKAEFEHKTEPYRRKLGMMKYRLEQRLLQCQARLNGDDTIKYLYAYESAAEFKQDLQLIHDSLHHHNDSDLANGSLRNLSRLLEVFDFYLNTLDIRQESIEHSQAVAEILKQENIAQDYLALSEQDKTELLNRLLEESALEGLEVSNLSEHATSILAVFELINEMREETGANCFDTYIISMAMTASHVLEVALLANIVGLNNGEALKSLAISPLFETIEDLENAPDVLDQLFQVPFYQKLLAQQQSSQEIMLGYSDSCKDGGIVASTWNLYVAQKAIIAVVDKYQLQCCFFHGRGGTVARGGGDNVFKAIQTQPAGTVRGAIKFTEQGEVLSNRYQEMDTALYELTMGISGLLLATINETNEQEQFLQIMSDMVEVGETKYRDLTDDNEDLMRFFYEATPTKQIGLLNIGSRPSHRKKLDYSKNSIRAIGWVFAWSQSRFNIPSWFGLGSALQSQDLNKLRDMYANFPFFRAMLDKTEMVLGKTDIDVARIYANLVEDQDLSNNLYEQIKTEFELTLKVVLDITQKPLLAQQSSLKASLDERYSIISTLNCLQAMLIGRVNQAQQNAEKGSSQDSEWEQPLLRSINALSVGMRNTG